MEQRLKKNYHQKFYQIALGNCNCLTLPTRRMQRNNFIAQFRHTFVSNRGTIVPRPFCSLIPLSDCNSPP